MNEVVHCPVCRAQVVRSSTGVLLHTRTVYEGRKSTAVVCEGSARGARPDEQR